MTTKKKTVKKVSRTVEGKDAKVILNIFTPEFEPIEFRLEIPNIVGNAVYNHRKPQDIASAVISGLRKKYGNNVK